METLKNTQKGTRISEEKGNSFEVWSKIQTEKKCRNSVYELVKHTKIEIGIP